MLVVIEIAPHERHEALEAYRRHLTDEQVSEIEDAAEDNWITLHMGGGPTRVTVVRKEDEFWLDSELMEKVEFDPLQGTDRQR